MLRTVISFTVNSMPKPSAAIQIFHGRRWPVGIVKAAERLDVTPQHLRAVLAGERTSPRVLREYSAMCKELTGKPFKPAKLAA